MFSSMLIGTHTNKWWKGKDNATDQGHSERSSAEQMRDESIVERTVRAVSHMRLALLSGYTTYRDLGTEGLSSHDASLRDAVNRGLTPGPRTFVATSCLATTGSYEIRTENYANGMKPPLICDPCDGPDGVRRAVRRRVAEGADIIKFYADYRRNTLRSPLSGDAILFPPMNRNPATVMFTQEEMNAIVSEAKSAGLPVACHAGTVRGVLMAAKAGVTSIEHGTEATDGAIKAMADNGCIYVPTLAIVESGVKDRVPEVQAIARKAHSMGLRLAAGGDTGAFNHGQGAREMELLMEAGVPVEDVLEACMLGGWESCGKDACGYRFGWLEKGARADIIALDTDPRVDSKALRKVNFVMKDAHVWKQNGIPVGFIDRIMEESAYSDATWELV
ncbi:amidohydrolase [Cordyceps fumosorosea ARSEF 2679]|uniref:Amidohydrolase n=1 Tax=Cordyceps fumosorosea (strain ARSEF 2679) TaxID=1081104 RepID=A0A168D464_CORFA|nr:amidohydrolase [Cordyceps fumosorosea ARSEF 2679]OAA72150.1 amidohydrolase [Cordyceps fumosorosea ARSEF 2679]